MHLIDYSVIVVIVIVSAALLVFQISLSQVLKKLTWSVRCPITHDMSAGKLHLRLVFSPSLSAQERDRYECLRRNVQLSHQTMADKLPGIVESFHRGKGRQFWLFVYFAAGGVKP